MKTPLANYAKITLIILLIASVVFFAYVSVAIANFMWMLVGGQINIMTVLPIMT